MKIAFLISNAYAMGGVVRATANLAAALATTHDVEVVSSFRTVDAPVIPFDPGVKITALTDTRAGRPDTSDPLSGETSELYPQQDGFARSYSALVDKRMAEWFEKADPDAIISTRPALGCYPTAFGGTHAVRIAQEHETFSASKGQLRRRVDVFYRSMDAVVSLTEADANAYRQHFRGSSPHITAVPNVVPPVELGETAEPGKLIVSAGRIARGKRFDVLVQAFARVVEAHPDWKLRIYGRGPEANNVRSLIHQLGLADSITLMGPSSALETEWVKGAFAATASDRESFGMTIVEAMRCGLPVVSTDCPLGPPEIIKHGTNGLLVPRGDPAAMADAMIELIEDPDRRSAMAKAARESTHRYDPDHIARRYVDLIAFLRERRRVTQPTGDCSIDGDGALRVTIRQGLPESGNWHLVCRPRKATDAPVSAQLHPLSTGSAPATCQAALMQEELDLPEGRYELFVQDARANDDPHRLRAGHLKLAGLLAQSRPTTAPVRWWIPYTTADGHLSLRTWRREEHAEADQVSLTTTHLILRGTLVNTDWLEPYSSAELVLRPRTACGAREVRTPIHCSGDRFEGSVALGEIAGAAQGPHDDWDVWLSPAAGAPRIRVARLYDDIVDRKRVHAYPQQEVIRQDGTSHVKPYFTPANELSVSAVTNAAKTEVQAISST
ncbi:glycosyltransferase family 4 protein [Streptomyces sp. MS2.AVA.5]|uniref:Glycosyltransferase family 4 protein n=1 Tax=Streptomyces achmelvichensis TaxID=3134111 RepID=A0ACC6Q8U0_9ACTN